MLDFQPFQVFPVFSPEKSSDNSIFPASWFIFPVTILTLHLLCNHNLASAVVDDKLYAIGGFAKELGNLDVNEMYDPKTDTWETLEPMPTVRNGLSASVLNGIIFAFGGEDTRKTFDENEAYIPEEDAWYALQPLPVPRQGLFSAVVDDTIYVMGGGIAPGASYSNLNHAYQNDTIPEFEFVVFLILILSLIPVIALSRIKIKKILFENYLNK